MKTRGGQYIPLLVKISPDLTEDQKRWDGWVCPVSYKSSRQAKAKLNLTPCILPYPITRDIASVSIETQIDGLICCNTTIDRPPNLASKHKEEKGGLSGQPVRNKSTDVIKDM